MRILSFLAVSAMLLFGASITRADSFSHTPDTLVFSPQQGDTLLSAYVRVAYSGDTTQPGTTVHAWISSGSNYFTVDTTRHWFKTRNYWLVYYHVQSGAVSGQAAFSDDTATQHVVLIAHAPTPKPDANLTGVGPYFSTTQPDSTSCTHLLLINTGADVDTIISAGWTHNPNGIFTWDTSNISLPMTVGPHDTAIWSFCFHAPEDTIYHTDTFVVYYHDSASQTRSVSRIVSARSAPDGEISSYGPYFSSTQMDSTTCTTMRMINTGSDRDTIISAGWTHNPNGIFAWDTSNVTFPRILNSHDTLFWNFCFHAPNDTLYRIDTFVVNYHDAYSGTRSISRVVYARAASPAPDGYLMCVGPYWTAPVKEGSTNCTTMRLINTGNDLDTIVSVGWNHDPNGIFTLDTSNINLPMTLGAHDTAFWTFCFNAPYDTNYHIDTFVVRYHDAYSQTRYVSRIVMAKAVDSSLIDCYYLYVSSPVPTVNVGDTAYIHLFISNRLDSSVSLSSLHISGSGDAAYRVDSSTFPRTIAAHHYDSLWLKFIPYPESSSGYPSYPATILASFTTNDTAHCKSAVASLNGYAAQVAHDTQTVYFSDTGVSTVDLVGDTGQYVVHRIDFVNNSSSDLRISSAVLTNTATRFLIVQRIPGLPDTVKPGGKFSIVLHFYGDSTGNTYRDTVELEVEQGLQPVYIYIKGKTTKILAKSGVSSIAPSAADLRIYPNPAHGMATLELVGTSTATYEVLDVLGNIIAQHSGVGPWQWNPENIAGGTYYVRAEGRDANGQAFITTRRIVLVR